MASLTVASIVFVCVFAGAMLGLFLRDILPKEHLSEDSMGVVKLGVGLIGTLAALVLGLLIASANSSFDRIDDEFRQTAVKVILLDRTLANYGSESSDARAALRHAYASAVELIFSERVPDAAKLDTPGRLAHWEEVQKKIHQLVPATDLQKTYQSDALTQYKDLAQTRWLIIEQGRSSAPTLLLVALVFWLAMIFAGFGLVAARNATVVTVLLLSALSTSAAIFLIDEMNDPLQGLIRISRVPMQNALSHLGQ